MLGIPGQYWSGTLNGGSVSHIVILNPKNNFRINWINWLQKNNFLSNSRPVSLVHDQETKWDGVNELTQRFN